GKEARAGLMAFAPDGNTLATVAAQTIHLWDIASGKELRKREGHNKVVDSMAYSPDGKLLAASSINDNSIRVWDGGTGKPIQILQEHKDSVRAVTFTPDGKTIVSGGVDNTIRLWDKATGKEVRRLNILPEHHPDRGKWGHQVIAMWLSRDGTTV